MGRASDEVVEGGAHPGRLSLVRRGAEAVTRRRFKAMIESDGRREWQRGPAAVGGREEGEGTTRWQENRLRAALIGDGEDNAGTVAMWWVSACFGAGG
jgi:hypothetical protein